MDFVDNRMGIKSIVVTMGITFLIGRIQLFGETFPGAIALITVMMAVSTIYIYLAPILLAAMGTYMGQGLALYGDFVAVAVLALLFAFFHQQKFSVNQRTAIAVMVTIFCHCAYAAVQDVLFLLRPETLLKEAIAIAVYVRVWNLLAKLFYTGPNALRVSRDKVELAMGIFVISAIGAMGMAEIVLPLWLLIAATVLLQWGIRSAFSFLTLCGVFWYCQGELQWEIFPVLLGGILIGWYGTMTVERQYSKVIVAASVFLTVVLEGDIRQELLLYGIALGMMTLVAISPSVLDRAFCLLEERFVPEFSTEKDMQYFQIRKDLLKKRDAFAELGNLYCKEFPGREIISYQFMGMARTLTTLMEDLNGKYGKKDGSGSLMTVSTASSSYAYGEISGDSMGAFAFSPYHIALIISDGMGKGSRAAEESRLVVETLTKLLQAGFDVDLAMKTINGILMTGNQDDGFATVDLAIIDRKQRRAKIFKMGAATTFIKHDGKVSMLKRQALPAGITEGLNLEYLDIKLKRGDTLIMVSDGITDCDRQDLNCDWLRQRLLEIHSKDPETIAELVINKAAEKYGIRERDDLSVLAATMEG